MVNHPNRSTSETLKNFRIALVAMARRGCRDRNCGIKDALLGGRHRHARCEDCPLDDVDLVWDEFVGKLRESEPATGVLSPNYSPSRSGEAR